MSTVTMNVAVEIQGAVAERAHLGFGDMEPLIERFVAQGYEEDQVRETVEAAIEELVSAHL